MLLNAVMCVWNEEDIIESTVKHLFAQGCSNIFIVDNASTDSTVDIAVNAGAKLAAVFESKYFDEIQKITHLNTVVRNYNRESNEDYVWWLYVDADEFPNIDYNLILRDFLNQLDISVRAVHGYLLNHIPTHQPYHISAYHPADFQPICTKSKFPKIPLLRYDKNKPHLYSAGGAHTVNTCGEIINVAKDVLNIHHFTLRKPEYSIERLKQLVLKRPDGTRRIDWMDEKEKKLQQSLTASSSYQKRYENSKAVYSDNKYKSLTLTPIYSHKHITRWYNPLELNIPDCSKHDILLCNAIHYFFLEEYDLALFSFNDLLEITNDPYLKLLVTIKMAECLAFTDKELSLSLLKPILKCNYMEIRDYCIRRFQRISESDLSMDKDNRMLKFDIQQYYGDFDKKNFV